MSFDELNKTDLGYNGFTDFDAGAQSRQAEIDELHARINEALFKIKRSHGRVMGAYLEDILKGESE